jgi:hypothetical protein
MDGAGGSFRIERLDALKLGKTQAKSLPRRLLVAAESERLD